MKSCRRLVCCVLLFSLVFSGLGLQSLGSQSLGVPVFAQAASPEENTTFFVNIYNDEDAEFFLQNTELTARSGITLLEVLGELKKQEFIKDYTLSEDSVTSIELSDGVKITTSPPPDAREFYVKHNGEKVSYRSMNLILNDGDIVEWVYGAPIQTVISSEGGEMGSTVSGRVSPIDWNESYKQAAADAADYLLLNHKESVEYIVAMGSVGKSVDMKTVNTLLGRVRQEVHNAPYESMAKDILAVTFAGYDASEPVTELSEHEGPLDVSVIDAIWMLIAYDCKKYEVSDISLNSRNSLIELLLSAQKETGGFSLTPNSSEDVFITSMAMTALSGYSSQIKVDTAIQKAVSYLAGDPVTDEAPFIKAASSSRLLSAMIIGLTSANVSISDERFLAEEENLLDALLKLQNKDGGFSESPEELSGLQATEFALVALAAVKNNKYPYSVDQRLTQIKRTTGERLAQQVKSMSPVTMFLVGIATLIALSAIIGSFVLKHLRQKVDEYAQELEK